MTHFQGGDGEDTQLPGQPVGHSYRRFEVLGTGAMGTVYRGEDRRGNDLAVKLLRAELAADPVVLARFIQERALLLRLASPNIVRVVDLVVEGDTVAIVMEKVDGGSLSQYLKRRGHRLGTAEAIQICIDVLEGLSVAHAQGVVHRDIKPDNVLIDDTSSELRAKVTDFGIAGLIEGSAHTRLTSLVGTPEYMAPELVESLQATSAVDVYSAGIVLYELVAGRTPFGGGSVLAILKRHAEQNPERPDGIGDDLWSMLTMMLAKDPGARPTTQQAQQGLEALLEIGRNTLLRAPRNLQPSASPRPSLQSPSGIGSPLIEAVPNWATSNPPSHDVDMVSPKPLVERVEIDAVPNWTTSDAPSHDVDMVSPEPLVERVEIEAVEIDATNDVDESTILRHAGRPSFTLPDDPLGSVGGLPPPVEDARQSVPIEEEQRRAEEAAAAELRAEEQRRAEEAAAAELRAEEQRRAEEAAAAELRAEEQRRAEEAAAAELRAEEQRRAEEAAAAELRAEEQRRAEEAAAAELRAEEQRRAEEAAAAELRAEEQRRAEEAAAAELRAEEQRRAEEAAAAELRAEEQRRAEEAAAAELRAEEQRRAEEAAAAELRAEEQRRAEEAAAAELRAEEQRRAEEAAAAELRAEEQRRAEEAAAAELRAEEQRRAEEAAAAELRAEEQRRAEEAAAAELRAEEQRRAEEAAAAELRAEEQRRAEEAAAVGIAAAADHAQSDPAALEAARVESASAMAHAESELPDDEDEWTIVRQPSSPTPPAASPSAPAGKGRRLLAGVGGSLVLVVAIALGVILLTGSNNKPAAAATVDGDAISEAQLNSDLAAVASSAGYRCFLDAQNYEITNGESQLFAAPKSAFDAYYLQTEIGHQVVFAVAATKHIAVTPEQLTEARASLSSQITSVLGNAALSSAPLQNACGSQASDSASMVLASLPPSFVANEVRFVATDNDLELIESGVGDSPSELETYFDQHRSMFDMDCYLAASFPTLAAAQTFADTNSGVSFPKAAFGSGGGKQTCVTASTLAAALPASANFAGLGVDQVSPPFGDNGQYLLLEITSQKPRSFNEVNAQVRQVLENNGSQPTQSALSALEDKASVWINPRYGTWQSRDGAVVPPKA